VRYVPEFLTVAEADALFALLLKEVDWQVEEIRLFGKRLQVPRRVAWFGDRGLCYRYSNTDHEASGWPSYLTALRDRLTARLPRRPDFVLLNRYRSGDDSMGWHTDDEAMASEILGSVSLGGRRRFLVRTRAGDPAQKLELAHGSLLMLNRHIPHCLPKTRQDCGERINLSFRSLL